jgi:hypothetical protein
MAEKMYLMAQQENEGSMSPTTDMIYAIIKRELTLPEFRVALTEEEVDQANELKKIDTDWEKQLLRLMDENENKGSTTDDGATKSTKSTTTPAG